MTTFSDDFNRADSTNLGSNWVEVSGDWSIVSNQLSSGTTGGTIVLRAAGPMSTNDNYAQATIAATTALSQGVWCRGNSDLTSGYLWRNNGTSWSLFSVVAGTFSSIATYAAAAAAGDVAKIQAVGSTIKAFVNGVQRASVTDTSVATGLNVGIRCEASSFIRWDNFAAGDVITSSAIGISVEVEAAQSINGIKTSPLSIAAEIETTQVISGSKSGGLGIAAEIEGAQQLVGMKSGVAGISNEQEASQSLGGAKVSIFGVASSDEYALPITGTKAVAITPAVELNTALTLTSSSGGGTTPVDQSILNSIKKVLSLASDDPSFDVDVLIHINSVFSDLTQLGVGPDEGFEITDADATWDTYIDSPVQNSVKSYMYLRLRMIFDPPSTGYAMDAMDKQIQRFEWRLNVEREGRLWRDPTVETV